MSKVIILGGGVAGLSAAHHLIANSGHHVTVVEKNGIVGGKARSYAATGTQLPAEHGLHFFGGFYRHVIETLKQIEYNGTHTVFDRLIDIPAVGYGRRDKPIIKFNPCPFGAAGLGASVTIEATLRQRFSGFELSSTDFAAFVPHILRVMTSCKERRIESYNKISWWDFIEADCHSENYQVAFARTLRTLVAADPKKASAKVMGDCALALLLGLTDGTQCFDRVLDGPTNEAWLNPWQRQLDAKGVAFRTNTEVTEIRCSGSRITSVGIRDEKGDHDLCGDVYLCAFPVEVVSTMLTPELLAADPDLAKLTKLATYVAWMSGMQIYVNARAPIFSGHFVAADSDWAITAIPQAGLWPRIDFPALSGNQIADCLSLIVCEFKTASGNLGKEARYCTPLEIRDEIWAELQRTHSRDGFNLNPSMIQHFQLDPALKLDPRTNWPIDNLEPLLVNEVGTWDLRPTARTKIENLFLAGDYIQTNADLATMESAEESARRAVNEVLGTQAVSIYEVHEYESLELIRAFDRICYENGLGWGVG